MTGFTYLTLQIVDVCAHANGVHHILPLSRVRRDCCTPQLTAHDSGKAVRKIGKLRARQILKPIWAQLGVPLALADFAGASLSLPFT